MKRGFLILGFAACTSSQSSTPEALREKLGDIDYEPVANWKHHDTHEISREVSRWVPDNNPGKESITIIRAEAREELQDASPAKLQELLATAQATLPSPALGQPKILKTKQALNGVEMSADFVPMGLHTSYHRQHAMIIDGNAVVHVLYTAKTPDPDLSSFRQVVDSIHRTKVSS